MKLLRPLRAPRTISRRTVSAFADCTVCETAGLRLLPGAVRSRFEDDLWDLRGLADKARSVRAYELLWDFSPIINTSWRVVAKEVLLALLAPHHESVTACSLALRKFRSPRTCRRFLNRFTDWFNWLTREGVTSLEEVTQEHCDRFIDEQQWWVPAPGKPRQQVEPETLAESVRVVQLLTLYGELLSTDSYCAGFVPWNGRSTLEIVGTKWLRGNRTPVAPDHILQPLLATCLYLVNEVGPQLAVVAEQMRATAAERKELPLGNVAHVPALRKVIRQMRAAGEPLPEGAVTKLRTSQELGILNRLAWHHLSHRVGVRDISAVYLRPHVVPLLTKLATAVGFAGPWAREAPAICRHDNSQPVAWTGPLTDTEVDSLIANVLTACLVVTCALTGMRNSELVELNVGCRRTAQVAGKTRYRLAGRLIKGKGMGGVPDEWVVIEEVHRTVGLAERLTGKTVGSALFGEIALSMRLNRLREWLEETGNREYWGLPVIPEGPISARMLRRTLALSIAERPGGLLAAKIALKHISVATTEGYAARPGGSQRLFLAEAEEAEEEVHLRLTVEAFHEMKAGQRPAGPGARSLIEAFQHVDAQLQEAAQHDPKVLQDDRHLEGLLRKQSKTLHVGPANFCWFRDPSKALCLKLAGTPDATKPLIGMCDSARCPQATHHQRHRPIWIGQVTTIETFVESPRVAKGEKQRLLPERDRALRVVAEIDAASPAA
ncbi:integrase [Streptomyces sp. NPDC059003]|uniref:integrase n=1 Tax=Streptomyces sp. NPDC059003 TaxID=3346691 RepID=UPI0036B8B54D